jgi:hypothetical protein
MQSKHAFLLNHTTQEAAFARETTRVWYWISSSTADQARSNEIAAVAATSSQSTNVEVGFENSAQWLFIN